MQDLLLNGKSKYTNVFILCCWKFGHLWGNFIKGFGCPWINFLPLHVKMRYVQWMFIKSFATQKLYLKVPGALPIKLQCSVTAYYTSGIWTHIPRLPDYCNYKAPHSQPCTCNISCSHLILSDREKLSIFTSASNSEWKACTVTICLKAYFSRPNFQQQKSPPTLFILEPKIIFKNYTCFIFIFIPPSYPSFLWQMFVNLKIKNSGLTCCVNKVLGAYNVSLHIPIC